MLASAARTTVMPHPARAASTAGCEPPQLEGRGADRARPGTLRNADARVDHRKITITDADLTPSVLRRRVGDGLLARYSTGDRSNRRRASLSGEPAPARLKPSRSDLTRRDRSR